ncbi:MAG TPA: ribonuclease P protein component [Candidatus Pullichristensenella avicola]|nr:ribonuclease P protein component [Candidatus Pullichristensenella avicola]
MTVEERAVRADLRFPRACRLGRNRNYRYVYRKGKSYPSHSLVVIYLRAKDLKLGFSVSSKVGNAVVRNRVRRCLREDARLLRPRLKRGRYIFVARPGAARCPHAALTREMHRALERARLLEEGEA